MIDGFDQNRIPRLDKNKIIHNEREREGGGGEFF